MCQDSDKSSYPLLLLCPRSGIYNGTVKEVSSMADSTDQTFEADVLKADTPVLVDFWAVWCGPCQVQGPIVEEVAKEMGGRVKVVKLNVDENPVTAQKFGIMSIPTIMIFKGGTVAKQLIGVQSKETLMTELNKLTN